MRTRITLLIVSIAIFINHSFAQGVREIFDPNTNITWLGLDFTAVRFIGDRVKLGSESSMHGLIKSLNDLMIAEAPKFDVGKALDRPPLQNAISIAIAHNEMLDLANAVEDTGVILHLTNEDIPTIISSYDFGELNGIGVMFVVETFSKVDSQGVVWVTFINMNTKEVIHTMRYQAAPGGFGLRNYWAGSIYGVIKQVKSNYPSWKKK